MQIVEGKPGMYRGLNKTQGLFRVMKQDDVLSITLDRYRSNFDFHIQDESFKILEEITDEEVFNILTKVGISWVSWVKLFDGLYENGYKDGQERVRSQFKVMMGLQ